MRAADSDREAVAERLRIALNEGRLDLHEYDERLRQAYLAKTYGELADLVVDLPGTVPPEQSAVVPVDRPAAPGAEVVADTSGGSITRRWLVDTWDGYALAVGITVGIWAVTSIMTGGFHYFWPGWVAGPWGAVLLAITVNGLITGEPRRWAERQARKKQAELERKRGEVEGR